MAYSSGFFDDYINPFFPTVPGLPQIIDDVQGGPNRRQMEQQERINERNYQAQKEFAQMGIRWRVEDAKAAGLHPLAALGASSQGFSPSFQVSEEREAPWKPWARDLMGQTLNRAIASTQTKEERMLNELRMARELAEIDLIKAQTSNIIRPNNPPMPGNYPGDIPGQPDTIRQPQRKITPHKIHAYSEPGTISDVGWADTPTGLAPVPSQDVKERIEDQIIQEVGWSVRNQLQPTISFGHWGARPPWDQMKKRWPDATGYHWHPFKQEWQPSYKGRKK